METETKKKRQKRVVNFTTEEKRSLIKHVEKWPRIWNLADDLHCNKNALEQAWDYIAGEMGKDEHECKSAWTSLRESYRYRAKSAKKTRSGSEGGEIILQPSFSENIDWEFSEDMSFLPNISQKRRTSSVPNFNEPTPDPSSEGDSACSSNSSSNNSSNRSTSAYDYVPTPKRSRISNERQNSELYSKLDSIVQAQTKLIEARVTAEPESTFKNALKGIEYLLNQLPRGDADAACVEITQLLCQKIAVHNQFLLE